MSSKGAEAAKVARFRCGDQSVSVVLCGKGRNKGEAASSGTRKNTYFHQLRVIVVVSG